MPGREIALRDEPALAIEDGGGEVLALAHGFRERRHLQRRAHLLGDREKAVPEDGQRDGVEGCVAHRVQPSLSVMTRWPRGLTEAVERGSSSVVASASSMMAGPSMHFADRQGAAIDDRAIDIAASLRESRPCACPGGTSPDTVRCQLLARCAPAPALGNRGDDVPVHGFHHRAGLAIAVLLQIGLLEARRDLRHVVGPLSGNFGRSTRISWPWPA